MPKKRNILQRILGEVVRRGLYDLYPELLERQPLLRVSSDDEMQGSGAGNSFTQAAGSFNTHMWLQRAVNVLANSISPLGVVVTRGAGADSEYVDNHPTVQLLMHPNSGAGLVDMRREWVVNMLLGGEVGWEAVRSGRGKITELWSHNPEQFTVAPSSRRYRAVAGYKIDDGFGEPYNLGVDEFIHWKFYNPLQPFRGISPVAAVRYSIVIDQLAQIWTQLFFKNQARPDFAVVAPEGISKSERIELEAKLMQRFSGQGAHLPIILEQGVTDIKTFSWAPKDTEWLQQRQLARSEVAAIVGVPDEIMGFGKDTYENFAAAERILWTVTITPLVGLFDGVLTAFLRRARMLLDNETISTDLRQVAQLQEDRTAKIGQAKVLFSMGVPVNTISEYLGLGLPTVDGGDVGYLPMGIIAVDSPARGALPVAPIPPPAPAPVVAPPEEEADITEEAVEDATTDATAKAVTTRVDAEVITRGHAYGSAEHEAVWKRLQERIDAPVTGMQRIVKREFQRQQNEIGRKLRESKVFGRGLHKDNVPPVESLFDLEEEMRKWVDVLRVVVTDTTSQFGQEQLAEFGISGVFDLDRPEVRAQIQGLLETVARKTNETTWTDLTELFKQAEEAGEGIPKIQERLSSYFGDRKSDYQTERIARTTMTGASNAGELEAVRQVQDELGVVMRREWISAMQPGRTRDAHAAAHGQQVGLNEPYVVDGESLDFPGDPNGSPGNIINCLCGEIFTEQE
jgi:HK97 family phage portal protein